MVNTEIRFLIFFAANDGEALYSHVKTRQGADCGSEHELLTAQLRLKVKEEEKSTRPFRHEPNQIPYDYRVKWEVDSRHSDRVPEEYGRGLWHCTGGRNRDHPQEKEMQKGKTAVWGGLTTAEKKREEKVKAKEKRKDVPIWMQSSKE